MRPENHLEPVRVRVAITLREPHVEVVEPMSPFDWDRLCAADTESTFFHTRTWSRAVELTIPGWHSACVVATEDGRINAALPFMIRRRAGLRVLASMPFGGYGGVLMTEDTPGTTSRALEQRFFALARSPRVAYAELVDFSGRLNGIAPAGVREIEIESHHLDLSGDLDSIWHRFRPSNRNKIRHARRNGVIVRRAESGADFAEYHRIHSYCSLEWGRRPAPAAFFHHLSALDPAHVEMWMASVDGRVVAALLNFVHDGTVMNWGSVSLPEGKRLGAHNLLHAVAIESATARGVQTYNFGSNPGLDGVDHFKSSFGTTRRSYHVYRTENRWYRILNRVRARRA